MSTRWGVRSVDAVDPNVAVIDELRRIKQAIRGEIAKRWLGFERALVAQLGAIAADDKAAAALPEASPRFVKAWERSPIAAADFTSQRQHRVAENKANLTLLADFTREDGAEGWRWEGFGMRHGLVRDGEPVDCGRGPSGDRPATARGSLVARLVDAAGRSGSQSDVEHTPPVTISVGLAGGKYGAQALVVDQALLPERIVFLDRLLPAWVTLTAGGFARIAGGVDEMQRRVLSGTGDQVAEQQLSAADRVWRSERERDRRSAVVVRRDAGLPACRRQRPTGRIGSVSRLCLPAMRCPGRKRS